MTDQEREMHINEQTDMLQQLQKDKRYIEEQIYLTECRIKDLEKDDK